MHDVNLISVLVAALAPMLIGVLWYGPLFGKQWMTLTGLTKSSMKDMTLTGAQAMVLGFLASIVTTYVLAVLLRTTGMIYDMTGALRLTFFIWLGFVSMTQLSVVLWEGKKINLFALNTAYSLVAYLIVAAILVAIA